MGTLGKGTTFAYCATEGGSYTSFAKVRNSDHPGWTLGTVEDTHYGTSGSTVTKASNGWKEYKPIRVTLEMAKAELEVLESTIGTTVFYWKQTWADGSVWGGPGLLTDVGGQVPIKDMILTEFEITPTAAWAFTPGA
jgi:hypothetical protein